MTHRETAPHPRTIFVSDLDGTLLDANARVTPRSARLLNDAINRGCLFTVATARTPATVQSIMRDVQMRLPAIVMTGAAWWHFDSQTYSHVKKIDSDSAATVIKAFQDQGVTPFVYTLDVTRKPNILNVYFNSVDPTEPDRKFISQRKGSAIKNFYVGQPVPDCNLSDIMLFFASGDLSDLRHVADTVQSLTRCYVSVYNDVYNPGLALIEVFAHGVSKANALMQLKNEFQSSRLVVFGDNLNDLSMFSVADVPIAVDNALPRVKDAANIVIGDNNHDAVAQFLAGYPNIL